MKTLRFILSFLIVSAFLSANGDVILTQKITSQFVSLQNPGDFPEYKFIGIGIPPMGPVLSTFIVENGKYYPTKNLVPISFVAVKKSYLKGKDLKEIDWINDKNVIRPNLQVHPSELEESNSIGTHKVEYKIVGFSNNSMVVYRASEVFQFRNKNKADSICQYKYNGDLTGLSKVAR